VSPPWRPVYILAYADCSSKFSSADGQAIGVSNSVIVELKILKGSDNAPLIFVLVAGAGFEPATSGPWVGNRAQWLWLECCTKNYLAKIPGPQPLRWQTGHNACGYRAFPLGKVEFVLS
jgi:hypothetical protein